VWSMSANAAGRGRLALAEALRGPRSHERGRPRVDGDRPAVLGRSQAASGPRGGEHTSRPADLGSTRRAHARRSAASKMAFDVRGPSVRDSGIESVAPLLAHAQTSALRAASIPNGAGVGISA